jgi:adenine-specific DNA glycosylase
VAVWLERQDGRVLLRRVENGPLLVGLWLPPFAVLTDGADPRSVAADLAHEAGFAAVLSAGPTVRHGITHRDIRVQPFLARLSGDRVAEARSGWSWQDPDAPALPTSSLLAKLADACRQRRPRPAVDREG